MGKAGRIAIWLGGVALAGVSTVVAASSALADRNPLPVLNLWPANGWAQASASDKLLRLQMVENEGKFPEDLPADIRRLAEAGYEREPLAYEAIRNLAIAAWLDGDETLSRKLFTGLDELTRRDSLGQFWQLEDDLRRQDIDGALARYDLILRTSSSARDRIIPQMVGLMTDARLVPPLAELLRERPLWEEWFWRAASRQPQVATNTARLREAIGAPDDELLGQYDPRLMENLLAMGDYTGAARLGEFFGADADAGSGGNLLGSTDERSAFRWQMPERGDVVSEFDGENGQLFLSALSGANGIVARRLVALRPGRYRLSLESEGTGEDALSVNLGCAAEGAGSSRRTRIGQSLASGAGPFPVPASGCAFQWVELLVRDTGDSGFDETIETLAISPA